MQVSISINIDGNPVEFKLGEAPTKILTEGGAISIHLDGYDPDIKALTCIDVRYNDAPK